MKRIYRDSEHKMIAGICAGVGDLFDIDPTLVRLAAVFFTAATAFFPGIVVYIVGWFIMPEKTEIEQSGD